MNHYFTNTRSRILTFYDYNYTNWLLYYYFSSLFQNQVRSIFKLSSTLDDLNIGHLLVGQNVRVVVDVIIDFNVF